MATVLDRIKHAFRKGPRSRQLPPGAYPNDEGSGDAIGTIKKPPYPSEEDDDEDYHGVQNYNVPEQDRLRQQTRETVRSDDTENSNPYGKTSNRPSPTLNPPSSSFRGASSGFVPGLPMNNNNPTLPSNMNTGPNPTATNNRSSPHSGFPPILTLNQGPPNSSPPSGGGFPPGMNPNQGPSNSSPPSGGGFPFNLNPNQGPSNNAQPSGGGFPFNMNPNQTQPQSNLGMNANQPSPSSGLTNPQSSDVGRPPAINLSQTQPPANSGMNPNQTAPSSSIFNMLPGIGPIAPNTTSNLPPNNSNNMMNTHQGSLPTNTSSFRNQTNHNNNNDDDDNVSRLELDYPIENVLIDANIPSTVAIKINDAIERDRFGHAHHVHRYTFESPTPQHIAFSNNQHINRHSTDKTHHGGTRHIREIPDNHQNFSFDNFNHSQQPNRHNRRRHHHNSDASVNDYIEQLLYPPGSVVIHAQNSNDIQHILNQHISNNQTIPLQSSANSFLPNNNTLTEPIFYYTARALPNDPMRIY